MYLDEGGLNAESAIVKMVNCSIARQTHFVKEVFKLLLIVMLEQIKWRWPVP
jgi:hypothetical protein